MRCKSIVFLTVILLTTGLATAATVWNPAANPDPNVVVYKWVDAANWTAGVPTDGIVTTPNDGKAVFNVLNAAECIVDAPVVAKTFVMGDNGNAAQNNVLRIVDGGSITTTSGWSGVSYNRPGTLIVEAGASCYIAEHFWISRIADASGGGGTVILNGGTISNAGSFQIGRVGTVTVTGTVTINDGVLNMHHGEGTFIETGSLMDIGFGTFIIGGDRSADCATYAGDGRLVAFGGTGTLNIDFDVTNPGKTTVTANHPLNPTPADGAIHILNGTTNEVTLSWDPVDPNNPGDPVYYDVWFGTDPNKLAGAAFYDQKADGTTDTSVTVLGLDPETYYWQVDSYIYNSPDANMIEGPVFYFDAVQDGPPTIVIDTPPTLTWAGEPVTLTATVTDDQQSASSVVWSDPTGDDGDPNIIYTNESYVYPTATVTVTSDSHQPNTTITATVSDGNPLLVTGSDTVLVDFAESACQGAGGGFQHLWEVYNADFDRNCIVNLLDFAVVAEQWLTDYKLTGPAPIQ